MNNRFASLMLKIIIIIVALVLSGYTAHSEIYPGSVKGEKTLPRDVTITLSVFSGRPNPQWRFVPADPEYGQLIALIGALKTQREPLFNHDKWNRLGYATFWIDLNGGETKASAVHVWRDMAYVLRNKEGQVAYALGATKLYDTLVSQAEKRDFKKFFMNYRRSHQAGK